MARRTLPQLAATNAIDCAKRLCGMNNSGVDNLAEGRYHVAYSLFSNTLIMAESLISCRELVAMDDDGDGTPTAESSNSFQTVFINEKHHESRNERQETLASFQGTFIYQGAILLNFSDDTASAIPSTKTICTVLLYNMAIALHLRGVTSFSTRILWQASTFYKLALSSHASRGSLADLRIPVMFYAAIFNNLGEIYFHLCQYDDMAIVYSYLKELSCSVVEERDFSMLKLNGFLRNLILLKKPDIAAAA